MINPFFHSVAIMTSGGPSPAFVGSGVLLRIDGIDYVASASHVVDELSGPVGIAVVKGNEVRGFMDKPERIVAVKQQDRKYEEGLDLALLLATSNYRNFLVDEGMSFFDLDKNNPPPVTIDCFISGFAARKNYYDRQKMRFADTCACCHIQSFMENAERVRSIGGDPEFHFALETKKRRDFWDASTNKKIQELFDLDGMSGGGVWHMPSGQGAKIPECATGIAGILIEDWDTQNNRQGLAKVVKIDAIRNLINFAKSQPETLFFVE